MGGGNFEKLRGSLGIRDSATLSGKKYSCMQRRNIIHQSQH